MSDLRERAAIAAMNGLLCDGADRRTSGPVSTAQTAVEYANALLAELARTSPVRPEPLPRAEDAQPSILDLAGVVVCKAEPTAGACTAAERELIEAAYMQETAPTDLAWSRYMAAIHAVRAERRAASEAKGGE